MKRTIVLVAAVATFLATWFSLSAIGWMISDATLKEVATNEGVIMIMLVFGWIPSTLIVFDVAEKLEGQ